MLFADRQLVPAPDAVESTGTRVHLQNDGLSVWYGGEDTPAPHGDDRQNGAVIVVGVSPAHPSNAVSVCYQVKGEIVRTLSGVAIPSAARADKQYFRATFPNLPAGTLVTYEVILSCAGRQVPASNATGRSLSNFRVAAAPVGLHIARLQSVPEHGPGLAPQLEYVSSLSLGLDSPPQVIGETPDGIRINFYVSGGRAVGPRLNAEVLAKGIDSMIVRRDGVGEIRVRAALRTSSGGMLSAEYDGICDWGEDGYRQVLAGDFPEVVRIQVAPRFFTGDANHRWMNRSQFVGVGQVRTQDLAVNYDLYRLAQLRGQS